MAVTPNSIITPQTPIVLWGNLTGATALTSRAPITGTTGLTAVMTTANNTNGFKLNYVTVKGASSSATAPTAAQLVYIWVYNATTSYLADEYIVTVVTPNTTTIPSFKLQTFYSDWIIPAGHGIYVSTTVNTTSSTTALLVEVGGGYL
jgi:hypothetical protein